MATEVTGDVIAGEHEPRMPVKRDRVAHAQLGEHATCLRVAKRWVGHERIDISLQHHIAVDLSLYVVIEVPGDAESPKIVERRRQVAAQAMNQVWHGQIGLAQSHPVIEDAAQHCREYVVELVEGPPLDCRFVGIQIGERAARSNRSGEHEVAGAEPR